MLGSANQYITSIYFNTTFNDTWYALRDVKITNYILNNLLNLSCTEPAFIKGETSYERGADFFFTWKDMIKLFFRVEEIIDTDYYKRLKWFLYKTDPPSFSYYFTLHLHNLEHKCFLTTEINHIQPIFMTPEEVKVQSDERYMIFSGIGKKILAREHLKFHEENVFISASKQMLSKIILNMKLLRRVAPSICDSIEYEGEKIDVGMEVNFVWKSTNMNVKLIVKDIVKTKDLLIIHYQNCSNVPNIPDQEIEWKVKKISDKESLVSFKHKFNDVIKKDLLMDISKQKVKILKQLKESAEKHFLLLFNMK